MATSNYKDGAIKLLSSSTLDNNTQALVLALLYIGEQLELDRRSGGK